MMHVYLETYGCQMNVADSELVTAILKSGGCEMAETPELADAILLNTCAVREHAEERIIGRVGELAQHKYERPQVIIGVLGCMAQHLGEDLIKRSRFVDIVAGPDSYRRLPGLLERARAEKALDVRLDRRETYDGITPERADGVTAWLTVQRGCDKCCTFCVVPAVRGRERCIPLADLVLRAEKLAAEGVREITLLGQTVSSYTDGEHDFAALLLELARIPELLRIRFTSPYPTDFSPKLIEAMAKCEKIARHVHLPLQSASDAVLKKARRRYTIADYDAVLQALRAAMPGMAVSTDIIAGFHGEGENEFQETCDYIRKARFDFAFMFKYSRRSRTAAWRWQETVDEETKSRRLKTIIDIQEQISREVQQACVGQTARVLVEGVSKREDGWLFGKTSEFRQVVFEDPAARPGDMVDVKVVGATGHTLIGERAGAAK